MYISPFTLEQDEDAAAALAMALKKVNEMIRQIMRDETDKTGEDYDGPLDGIDNILDCLIERCWYLKKEFEHMRYWAEDANINIRHERHFGKDVLIETRKYKQEAIDQWPKPSPSR